MKRTTYPGTSTLEKGHRWLNMERERRACFGPSQLSKQNSMAKPPDVDLLNESASPRHSNSRSEIHRWLQIDEDTRERAHHPCYSLIAVRTNDANRGDKKRPFSVSALILIMWPSTSGKALWSARWGCGCRVMHSIYQDFWKGYDCPEFTGGEVPMRRYSEANFDLLPCQCTMWMWSVSGVLCPC